MRVLVLSDIHANRPALEAIRESADAKTQRITEALSTTLRTGKPIGSGAPGHMERVG